MAIERSSALDLEEPRSFYPQIIQPRWHAWPCWISGAAMLLLSIWVISSEDFEPIFFVYLLMAFALLFEARMIQRYGREPCLRISAEEIRYMSFSGSRKSVRRSDLYQFLGGGDNLRIRLESGEAISIMIVQLAEEDRQQAQELVRRLIAENGRGSEHPGTSVAAATS